MTADATGKAVYAGPAEATAIGNILVQMINNKEFYTLQEARQCIYNSFQINKLNITKTKEGIDI